MDNYRFYLPARVRDFMSTEPEFSSCVLFLGCISWSRRWRPRWLYFLSLPLQIRALFWSWLESKSLFLAIDMEFNLSSFDINVCICSAQEGSPKNERCLHVLLHVKYYKIHRNKEVLYFYRNILSDSYRVVDRLVGQLQHIDVGVSVE